jgi:hypothetical protein
LLMTLRCGDAARRAQSMHVARAGWDLLMLPRIGREVPMAG